MEFERLQRLRHSNDLDAPLANKKRRKLYRYLLASRVLDHSKSDYQRDQRNEWCEVEPQDCQGPNLQPFHVLEEVEGEESEKYHVHYDADYLGNDYDHGLLCGHAVPVWCAAAQHFLVYCTAFAYGCNHYRYRCLALIEVNNLASMVCQYL